jgi:hypothetical protein
MTAVTQTAALMDLLGSLFSDPELRVFVVHRLPGGDKVVGRLPGAPCTHEHLVDQTAQVLERQGLVTRELFDALLVDKPGRREDIERVAATWGVPLAAAPAPATVSASPTTSPTTTSTTPAPDTWDVFISYARADLGWVNTLAENLHGLGLRVFFDEWEIGAGDVVVHRLDQGLRESCNGILIVSQTSMTRAWVLEEYAALLTGAVAKKLRLIPVLYADAEMPPMLATRAWIDFRGKTGEEYLEQVRRLAKMLKGERPGPPPLGPLRAP